jgi:hypothetical protein
MDEAPAVPVSCRGLAAAPKVAGQRQRRAATLDPTAELRGDALASCRLRASHYELAVTNPLAYHGVWSLPQTSSGSKITVDRLCPLSRPGPRSYSSAAPLLLLPRQSASTPAEAEPVFPGHGQLPDRPGLAVNGLRPAKPVLRTLDGQPTPIDPDSPRSEPR